MPTKKSVLTYVFIIAMSLLIIASVGFNVMFFWKQYSMGVYNAGIEAAARAVYDQAQKGDVTITVGQDTLTLVKKPQKK